MLSTAGIESCTAIAKVHLHSWFEEFYRIAVENFMIWFWLWSCKTIGQMSSFFSFAIFVPTRVPPSGYARRVKVAAALYNTHKLWSGLWEACHSRTSSTWARRRAPPECRIGRLCPGSHGSPEFLKSFHARKLPDVAQCWGKQWCKFKTWRGLVKHSLVKLCFKLGILDMETCPFVFLKVQNPNESSRKSNAHHSPLLEIMKGEHSKNVPQHPFLQQSGN